MSINSINSNNIRNKTKSWNFVAKASLLIFLALAGNGFIQQASAQTRNVTKDTTEIRNFFRDTAIFSAVEIKEFDMLWNKNLKSPIGEFLLEEIMDNFYACGDYEQTVLTCILLDPKATTSLWKRAFGEIGKNSSLKGTYDIILKHIHTSIILKEKQTELKEAQEVLKRLKELEKILLEAQKVFEQNK